MPGSFADAYVDQPGGGGGGGDLYTNATLMPQTVGGWEAGSTFSADSMSAMWTGLLYPYQYPLFTSFSMSGQAVVIEVGTTLSGVKTFTWGTSNSGNVNANSVSLRDQTASVNLATGLANIGTDSVSIGTVQKTTATSNTWRVGAVNSKSQAFTRDFSVAWEWMFYYGESASAGPLNAASVAALRVAVLSSSIPAIYSYVAGGYKYLCYPAVLGTATSFKDALTQLDVPFETLYTVSITNAQGVTTNYNVHRSTNVLGAAIDIVVS